MAPPFSIRPPLPAVRSSERNCEGQPRQASAALARNTGASCYSYLVGLTSSIPVDDVEKRFAEGGEAALADAYALHGKLVYTFCRRTVGASTAEDITQEVFIKAYLSREQFNPDKGSLAGWLVAIARNRLIDHFRAEQHLSRTSTPQGNVVAAPEPRIEQIGDKLMITEALRQLPQRVHNVITLHYFDDLTHKQIADRLDMPMGTVKSDLRRGLAQIRHQLESTRE